MEHIFCLVIVMVTPIEGMNTRCEAPPVQRGEEGAIICIFEEDIRQNKDSFIIHKFDQSGYFEEVLDCQWESTNVPADLICETKPKYFYDKPSGRVTNFTLKIRNTTEEDTGSYVCQVIPSNPLELTPCNMTLKEMPNEGNDSGNGIVIIVIAIAGPVSVFIVGAAIFVICLRRSKRRKYAPTENQALDERQSTANDGGVGENVPLNTIDETGQDFPFADADQSKTTSEPPQMRSLEKELFEACKTGDEKKVNDICPFYTASLFVKDENGDTALLVASRHDQAGVVERLLEHGALMYARDNQQRTAMHIASYYGALSVIDVLLKYKMKTDTRDKDGSTPLQVACKRKKRKETSETSKSNSTSEASKTSDAMINTRQADVVLKLLDAGADARVVDVNGRTLLHLACHSGNEAIAKTLLSASKKIDDDTLSSTLTINISVGDNKGQTPLHMACLAGSKEIVQILISYGADLTATDKNGLTPELLARECGHKDIAKYISKALKGKEKERKGNRIQVTT